MVVAGTVAMIGWYVPWPMVLTPSLPTGGDTPSHYAALVHFITSVLPKFRLWGWDAGNLAGYPFMQFYFPLPFLIMAGVGQVVDLTVAFKLVTLAPALLLPVSVYFSLRWSKLAFPGPAVGAVLSLSFLLAETNKVWGGNLASILAGEIAYAVAFNLVLLFLPLYRAWMRGERGPVLPSILLFLIGLGHAYALLFSLVAGLYPLLAQRRFRASLARLLVVYGVAFFLLGLWTIPMLAYSPYTEMFNFIWIIDSWEKFLPQTLWPVFILALIGIGLGWWLGDREDIHLMGFWWFWILSSVTLYLCSPFMNAVTIRFGPFGHLAAVLLAAQGIVLATKKIKAKGVLALALLLAGTAWPGARVEYLDHWLNWNNAGLERQSLWRSVERLSDYLRPPDGSDQSPPSRVIYEHTPLSGRAGSVRVFESLPFLAGRPTLEGLYLQASPNAPFVFYLQSETCLRSSSPLPGYVYSRLNLARAVDHMRLFDVEHYIVAEQATRRQADREPGLILKREFPPYSIYRVTNDNPGLAVVPRNAPVLVITARPQQIAYHWFRMAKLDVPLVLARARPPGPVDRFAGVFVDSGHGDDPLLKMIREDRLPRRRLPTTKVGTRSGLRNPERIEVTGCRPGRPILIRTSYHPAWRARGGETIHRATPAFMLVFPKSETIVLEFGPRWPHHLGVVLTLFGICLTILFSVRPSLLRMGFLDPGEEGVKFRWWPWMVVLVWVGGLGWLLPHHDDAATLRNKGRELNQAGHRAEAREMYRAGINRFPISLVVDYTWYDLAMSYYEDQDYSRAEKNFTTVLRDFPDSILIPETLYHLGWTKERLGRLDEAKAFWQRLTREFPENRWSREAERQLE